MTPAITEAAAALREHFDIADISGNAASMRRLLDAFLAAVETGLREAREAAKKEGFDGGAAVADSAWCRALGLRAGEESIADFRERIEREAHERGVAACQAACIEAVEQLSHEEPACSSGYLCRRCAAVEALVAAPAEHSDALERREASAREEGRKLEREDVLDALMYPIGYIGKGSPMDLVRNGFATHVREGRHVRKREAEAPASEPAGGPEESR